MVAVKRSFEVSKPLSVVLDYLQDFARTEEWDPGTKSCTRTDSGPIAVGSRWHNVSEFRGRQTELEYQLKELTADHLVFQGDNKTVSSTDDISLAKSPTGTRISYRATLDFHGLAKLAGPFLQRGFEKVADDTVRQMAGVINDLPG